MRIGTRWWIISLVTIGTVLNYLARSSLSVAAPTLKGEFAMTTQQYSWVVASFQAAYTVMQPVAGYLLDLMGLRLALPCLRSAGLSPTAAMRLRRAGPASRCSAACWG